MSGEGAKRGIKASLWIAPVLSGRKDKVTRINYEPITVSLRQLHERRGLPRLRNLYPLALLRRMCTGSGGNRGWNLTAALIGRPSAREFGRLVAPGETRRLTRP